VRDTIYAVSSGRPPAAIAVIRISGPLAHRAAVAMAGELPEARTVAVRELRHPLTRELLDQGLVLSFHGPASSTGEDVVELHCHGGRAVVDGLLACLAAIDGLREAEPGEFTRRAFENGRIDLTEAEGLADLIEAETESQRRVALQLADGELRRQIASWQERLLDLSAKAERAIDYAEEDQDGADDELHADVTALASELARWLEHPRIEPLKDGVRVVVAGPPNVGKSSLVNVIACQDKAIVTDQPGTTRDQIEVPLAIGGMPVLLVDTAGLREAKDRVEAIGVERARRLLDTSDIVVWLGPAAQAPDHPRLIQVGAKADLGVAPGEGLPVSSMTGEGVEQLLGRIEELAESLLPAEDGIALNRRQADCLAQAASALAEAESAGDPVLLAEDLRAARAAFDRMTGRAGVEDLLDALFSRFCLGK
jgi:tRNA modification GTPase